MGDFLKRWLSISGGKSNRWSTNLTSVLRFTNNSRRLSYFLRKIDHQTATPPTNVDEFKEQMIKAYGSVLHRSAIIGDLSKIKSTVKSVMQIAECNLALPSLRNDIDGVIKVLVEHADVLDFRRTVLHQSAANGHLQVVKYLVQELKADVFARDSQNNSTAIHLACQNGHLEVVRFFLEWNPHLLDIEDQNQSTPLNAATLGGHLPTVKLLVNEKNADIENKSEQNGATPLLQAARKGHLEVLKFLIDAGANFFARERSTDMGDMAIHLAAAYGHTEIVRFLLNDCPDLLEAENAMGLNPYGYAMLANQWPVARLIENEFR